MFSPDPKCPNESVQQMRVRNQKWKFQEKAEKANQVKEIEKKI
jgi:hypothetical protein